VRNLVSHFGGGTQTEGFWEQSVEEDIWPKREEDGSWRKLHNDELRDLYSSPNIVRVIESRRMRWAGHVARMVEGRGVIGFWLGGPESRDHWEDLGVGGRIRLKWTLGRYRSMGRTGFGWLRIGSSGGLLWIRWWTFGFHKKAGYFLTSRATISFSNNILYRGVSKSPPSGEPSLRMSIDITPLCNMPSWLGG
jgi:hypothetical protein